jgi:hypothetical protein
MAKHHTTSQHHSLQILLDHLQAYQTAEIVKQDRTDSSCKQQALQNKFTENFGSNTFTLNPEFFLTQTDIDNITENAVTESGVNSAYNREEWHDKVKRNTWITT